MNYFANTSLLVSGESSFVVTTAPFTFFTLEIQQKFDYSGFVAGPILGIFGMGTNVVNAIIFYRQGLNTTINISFFFLAISDLLSMFSLSVSAIFIGPPVVNSDILLELPTSLYLTGGWQHLWFADITNWITAYITAERCLCIALPLKVKQIITPRVTSIIISVIYMFNILPAIPDFIYHCLEWKFSPKRNRTLLVLSYRENLSFLKGITPMYMTSVSFVPFPMIIVFTVILVAKLRQQTLWRQKSTHDSQNVQLTSRRETRTMNTVVLIAVILIISYIPGVPVGLATFFVPELSIDGQYSRLFLSLFYIVFAMHIVNASANIFLYYKMSSKFKRDFHQLFDFCICVPHDIDDAD